MLLLGLDIGTTAVKAAVVDSDGREHAVGRAATPWRTVPTGAELDPDALLAAALEAARAALEGVEGAVAGVGIASMAETGVLVDEWLRPVVPAIAWYDTRGADEAERIATDLPGFPERTGQPASAMCTLAKYAWMRRHWTAAERGTRWLNVAEWIVVGLGGEPGAEASLASRTGFYDLHTGQAWQPALDWADAPATLAPPHAPAGTALGRVGAPAGPADAAGPAAALGDDRLAALRGAVLAVGGHDHAAAAVGAGAAGEGDVLDSCGTAEAILRATAPLAPGAVRRAVAGGFTVGRHALAGRYVLQGAIWSGEALQALGVPRDALEAAALAAPVDGSPGARYLALLEQFGAEGAEVLARMEAIAGPARRLVVTGGWAEGAAARAVKARHLGPFEHAPAIYTGCRGAALAAARALKAT